MQIPRYWARANAEATSPSGERFPLRLWGWSTKNAADALAVAERRAADVAGRISRGELPDSYEYGRLPLREEIIKEIPSDEAVGEAVITRNHYGVAVLNTARLPIIDVDVPKNRRGLLSRLFGRGEPDAAMQTLDAIREACQRRGPTGFRIYQTKAGYRVIATHLSLDPAGPESERLLADFNADPCYARLCRVQSSYRARLTPKPWRCGCSIPPSTYPHDDDDAEAAFAKWREAYEAESRAWATCQLVEDLGSTTAPPGIADLIGLHDRLTRVGEELPLG